jgi:hypothetical protein
MFPALLQCAALPHRKSLWLFLCQHTCQANGPPGMLFLLHGIYCKGAALMESAPMSWAPGCPASRDSSGVFAAQKLHGIYRKGICFTV